MGLLLVEMIAAGLIVILSGSKLTGLADTLADKLSFPNVEFNIIGDESAK